MINSHKQKVVCGHIFKRRTKTKFLASFHHVPILFRTSASDRHLCVLRTHLEKFLHKMRQTFAVNFQGIKKSCLSYIVGRAIKCFVNKFATIIHLNTFRFTLREQPRPPNSTHNPLPFSGVLHMGLLDTHD
jgi:hypothetical protein